MSFPLRSSNPPLLHPPTEKRLFCWDDICGRSDVSAQTDPQDNLCCHSQPHRVCEWQVCAAFALSLRSYDHSARRIFTRRACLWYVGTPRVRRRQKELNYIRRCGNEFCETVNINDVSLTGQNFSKKASYSCNFMVI